MRKRLANLALGVTILLGARCAMAADPVAYLDPLFDVKTGAVTGMVERTCAEYTALIGNYSTDLVLADGWYVVVGNCTISKSVKTAGDVRLILKNGTSFVKSEADNHTGFLVEQGSLTVYAQSIHPDAMGVLQITGGKYGAAIGSGSADEIPNAPITINGGKVTATGGDYGAGIGSGKTAEEKSEKGAGQDITINGGIVTANGGDKSAGIGGGEKSIGQRITINGGTVVATGGGFGAGIGGGDTQDGCDITINGGHVTANGGKVAAGIGGGKKGPGHSITINGGIVTATGGDDSTYHGGAGIGGGNDGADDSRGEGYDIAINGGHVTATGGLDGAGIGGSGMRDGYNITINGGTVIAKGRENAAGIGGGDCGNGHHITINGGHVTAHGEYKSAGIGGGDDKDGHHITINGGYVEAKSLSAGGAGIGGGQDGNGYEILIGGGEVHAWSDEKGAGIGGGDDGKGYSITITNGYVEAVCSRNGGAGIGSGDGNADMLSVIANRKSAQDITISGGKVYAMGADGGAGIGAANDSACENILISGGTVVAQSINNNNDVVGGAGIGGGDGVNLEELNFLYSGLITISGGDITARGGIGAAGIGAGYLSSVTNITITGGNIQAYGGIKGGAGIGGGGCWGSALNITITGGRILALAGGSWTFYDREHYAEHSVGAWRSGTLWWGRGMDIGGGGAFDVTRIVRDVVVKLVGMIPEVGWIISGAMNFGELLMNWAFEISGMTEDDYGKIEKLRISGGTIEAHAIGGCPTPRGATNTIVIDGGSLLTLVTTQTPVNSAGEAVVPIQFKEAADFSPAHLVISKYGSAELYPDVYGDLYPWLPKEDIPIMLNGMPRKLTVWDAWQYTLDDAKPGLQVGDDAWAEVRNGVCFVVGNGPMWNVEEKNDTSVLWDSRNSISNLVIGGRVTSVGKRNFEYMKKLKRVVMSTNVVTVADQAFYMCYNVTNIAVGAGTQKIGAYAFQGCNSLETLSFARPVETVATNAYTLTALIRMEDGGPVVEAVPEVKIPGYEMVLFGKKELSDETWTLVTDENKCEFRFFKVVSQPK